MAKIKIMRATVSEYNTLRGKHRDIRFIEVGKFYDDKDNVEKVDFEYDSKAYQRSREANVHHLIEHPSIAGQVLLSNRI